MIKNEVSELRKSDEKLYGIYRGVVEEDHPLNPDPLVKAGARVYDGRIQVRVWGLHTKDKKEIPTEHLPLAEPAYPAMLGSISGKGCWSVPVQGSHVFVFFENGNHMQPRYFACAPGIEPEKKADGGEGNWENIKDTTRGFTDPQGIYPISWSSGEPDMNGLMYDENKLGVTAYGLMEEGVRSGCGVTKGPAYTIPDHLSDYPHGLVIETQNMQTLELNTNQNLLFHSAHSYIFMNDDGLKIDGDIDHMGDITTGSVSMYGDLLASGTTHNILGTTVNAGCCSPPYFELLLYTFAVAMVSIYNSHTHPGDSGGTTGSPNEQFSGGDEAGIKSTYSTVCLKGN